MLSARANLIFCAIFLVIDRYPTTAFIQRPKRARHDDSVTCFRSCACPPRQRHRAWSDSSAIDSGKRRTLCTAGRPQSSAALEESALLDSILARVPLATIGSPVHIAEVADFLASSDYITGQIIPVDGGRRVG